MNDPLWSDDEFRSFLSALRGGDLFTPGVDGADRDAFVRQARRRVAPEVQRRVLADIGVPLEASGIAATALDVLEDELWGKRRAWLTVAPDPWMLLADLVTREIRRSYRASVRRADDRVLSGIVQASTRTALPAGDGGDAAPES